MSDQTLFSIFFSAMVVNNFTLAMFLGLCPFMGVSARVETALRMGLANIFVLVLTSLSAWVLNTYILENAPYLRIIAFIIVVASLVQIVEMVVKKIAQLVVISGRKIPSCRNSTGTIFFTTISTICTSEATTMMKEMIRRYGAVSRM